MAEHNELGKQGEQIAIAYLKKKGYELIAINWVCDKLEVDIIAKTESYLVFIEVKTRNTDAFGHPASFVDGKKQKAMAEAVEAYLERFPEKGIEIRYDIVSVILQGNRHTVEHIEDAFWPDNLGLFSMDM